MKNKKAFIFDFDGTIGNTIPMAIESFKLAFKDLNLPIPNKDEIVAHFGPSEIGLLQRLNPQYASQLFQKYLFHYDNLHQEYSPNPFEGIADCISLIKKKSDYLGLITGKCNESAKISFKHYNLNIDDFDFVKTGDPIGNIKQISMQEAVDFFDINHDNIYYIGDAESDIIDSKAVKIKPVAVAWAPSTNKQNLEKLMPYEIFENISDFKNWIKELD